MRDDVARKYQPPGDRGSSGGLFVSLEELPRGLQRIGDKTDDTLLNPLLPQSVVVFGRQSLHAHQHDFAGVLQWQGVFQDIATAIVGRGVEQRIEREAKQIGHFGGRA
jgi:hypothetical protein